MTIIIYLSVVGALLPYMLFLLLVDPLIRKRDPYTQPLHNEEDAEVNIHTPHHPYAEHKNAKSLLIDSCYMSLVVCVFRKCVPQSAAVSPGETLCWSEWRERSSAGRSRSRNNARLFLIDIRCLVKFCDQTQK